NDGDVTGNHGSGDYWVVKISQTGSLVWQKSFGGSDGDYANSIKQTEDGGYIIAGTSYSNDGDVTESYGNGDYWIIKISETGNIEWQKSFGGSGEDIANEIQVVAGGYIVIGGTESTDGDVSGNHGNVDYWIIKLSESGDLQWQKAMGGSSFDEGLSIAQTNDKGFILAGGSNSNNGDVTGNHGEQDYWIVKLEPDPLDIVEFKSDINIYPNPASSFLNISAKEPIKSVSFYNHLGQLVRNSSHGETELQLNVSELSANIYLMVVTTEKSLQTFKIIIK